MKNCKKIVFNGYATLGALMRKTGISLSDADVLEVSVKDGIVMLKPTVSPSKAEELANAFLMECSTFRHDFEVNSRQRVVACAAVGHVGVAYCSKEDNFSIIIGKALALSRALCKPLPPLLQTYLGLN